MFAKRVKVNGFRAHFSPLVLFVLPPIACSTHGSGTAIFHAVQIGQCHHHISIHVTSEFRPIDRASPLRIRGALFFVLTQPKVYC